MEPKRFVPIGDFKLGEEEKAAIINVLEKGRITEWEKVKEFEGLFADYVGTKHCLAVSSGTSALLLGLLALKYDDRFPKVRDGAKIITSPVTYVATSNAIMLSNMEPVYVDIDKRTVKLIPEQIEYLLTKENPEEFAGILPVHLMGYPNDMDEINAIADKYDLVVFEDSAQAHGTVYKGQKTGSLGLLAGFSFYVAHNIQAGEMGCVTTNDTKLFRLMVQLKANGRVCNCDICRRSQGKCPRILGYKGEEDFDPRFTHEYISYNFKTMEFPAALGICQMKKADWIFQKRQENIRYLNSRLAKYNDLFYLPPFEKTVSYLAYPILIRERVDISRKWLRKEIEERGVENRPLFGCLPTQQPAYSKFKDKYQEKLPVADYVGKNGFYIGCHQYLEKEDLDYIVDVFEDVLLNHRALAGTKQ
jgi:CDP-6-deoxy-D-xylo-4-hexulose-3-dehydrase